MGARELLEQEDAAWRAFLAALESIDPEQRTKQGVVPGWSTHDLAWHCGAWAMHAADAMEQIIAGAEVEEPDYEAMEPDILAEGRTKSWPEAVGHAAKGRDRARAAFRAFDDPPEDAVEWFTDEAAAHYQEHADQIRAFAEGSIPTPGPEKVT